MTAIAFIILFILSICAWVIEGERTTHLEINQLITLIDELEQKSCLNSYLHQPRSNEI